MASIKSTLMLTNALQMLNIHVGLTNIKTLLRNDPPASLRLQMPGASSLSHIWLTTVDIKELSNGRVIWLHLVVLSCTLISPVPASTTELPATLPCSHVREENLNVLEHVNASIKPVLMKNAFRSWCPMFCTYWLAIDDNDGS